MATHDEMCMARVPLHFNKIGHLNGNISREHIYKGFHSRFFFSNNIPFPPPHIQNLLVKLEV